MAIVAAIGTSDTKGAAYGASSMERLPTEIAMTETARPCKELLT